MDPLARILWAIQNWYLNGGNKATFYYVFEILIYMSNSFLKYAYWFKF